MDFVFVSIQPIDVDRNSTSVSIARELSKNHRVLYVNPPLQRREYWFGTKEPYKDHKLKNNQASQSEMQEISPNLWMLNTGSIMESINWVPFTSLVKKLSIVNNRRMAAAIQKAIKLLGFSSITVVNDKDIFRSFYLKELLKPAKYVYLDRDYTLGVPYWKKHGRHMEPELMRKSDVVVCNSPVFTDLAKKVNANSCYIGNGFDSLKFNPDSQLPVPQDLAGIPSPRITYIGAMVSTRLDERLLVHIARERPEWHLVFLGWEDQLFARSELHRFPNVHFLGKRQTREVAAYLAHVDVAINPQLLNPITSGNFPLKIVEYLAMGLPVVASATDTMKILFSEQLYLAATHKEFVQQIENALSHNTESGRASRIEFSKKFSWQQVTKNFLEAIDALPGNQAHSQGNPLKNSDQTPGQ